MTKDKWGWNLRGGYGRGGEEDGRGCEGWERGDDIKGDGRVRRRERGEHNPKLA